VLAYLAASGATTLDLTGGAPELNPSFRHLVRSARARGVRVIDRCNLTILFEPGQEDLAEFLAAEGVDIVASLPCYTAELVNRQRGEGVYEKSVEAIRKLNALGYGREGSGLAIDLVYNPQGPSLPPSQAKLEADYKRILGEQFGIVFNRLYTIAEHADPALRLHAGDQGDSSTDTWSCCAAPTGDENLDAVMCRSLVSIDWQGYLYDCDFNQMLGLPLVLAGRRRPHLSDVLGHDLEGNPIVVRDHCYGCTAGQGSSCGGALA
jgi:radical SAM/Cys-rich protein